MRNKLINNGWKQAITTSTHLMFFKGKWKCTVSKLTGEVCFQRVTRIKVKMHSSYDERIE